jgi:acyl-CoA thioester hydrolase
MHANDAATSTSWRLQRRVLPQHTDHAGIMWHGAYVAWLEEARVEALAAAGLAYAELSRRGLELPVVGLTIDYRRTLRHGDAVEISSTLLPGRGLRLPWRSRFLGPGGSVAAEALVELVAVARDGSGPPRLLRRWPEDLARAITLLRAGPASL